MNQNFFFFREPVVKHLQAHCWTQPAWGNLLNWELRKLTPGPHSQDRRRTKLNQEVREHRSLLTQLITLDLFYSNHPLGETASGGGWRVDPAQHDCLSSIILQFLLWAIEWTAIQFTGNRRKTKYHLSQSLLFILILSYPSTSLLTPHINACNFGRQLKTGFSNRVRELVHFFLFV